MPRFRKTDLSRSEELNELLAVVVDDEGSGMRRVKTKRSAKEYTFFMMNLGSSTIGAGG